ncbi:MAG: hypothetical protein ABJM26_00490 [Anderseniella sp.]
MEKQLQRQLFESPPWRVLRQIAMIVATAFLAGCSDDIKLDHFLQGTGGSFRIDTTFGELTSTGPSEVAHYMEVSLTPNTTPIFAPTTGEIVFDDNLDGLVNCVIITPKLRDEDEATPLDDLGPGLADADDLRLALCNLDRSGATPPLEQAINTLYTEAEADDPADKTTRFFNMTLDRDDRRGNVWAAPEAEFPDPPADGPKKRWSRLGPAAGGTLKIAAFHIEDDHPVYVNPAPYLAKIPLSPPSAALRQPQIAEIRVETADDENFTTNPRSYTVDLNTGDLSPNEDLLGFVRVFYRLDNAGGGSLVAPHEMSYELKLDGTGEIRSHSFVYINSLPTTAAVSLSEISQSVAARLYRSSGAAGTVSDPGTDTLWLNVQFDVEPLDTTSPVPKRDIGSQPTRGAIDINATHDGQRRFPPGDYELEIVLASGFDLATSDTKTLRFTLGTPEVESVHPVNNDFAPGMQGRVLISTLHDSSYHTSVPTTAANQPAQREPTPANANENRVTISAYVQPVRAGQTVFFEVIDHDDPGDNGNASYVEDRTPNTPFVTAGDAAAAPNSAANDNRDPARSMAGGSLAAFNSFQAASLSARSATTTLATINGVQRAVAEVTLTITDRYAGDNYQVRATLVDPQNRPFNDASGVTADTSADADIAVDQIRSTAVLTAWKRVYVETDRMFRVGSDLTHDSGAAEAAPNELRVATGALGLAAGDQIQVFDMDDQLAPFGEVGTVQSVAADRIVLSSNLTSNYQVARRAHVGKLSDASAPVFVPFFQADTSDLSSLFAEAFVEVDFRADGSGPVPNHTTLSVNSGEAAFANRWFHLPSANRRNYFHVIGAHSAADNAAGGAPVPNHPTNATFTYVQKIETRYNAGDVPNVVRNTTAHELTHQFDDSPSPPQNHDNPANPGVVPAAGDVCIMSRGRDRRLPVKWGIFHVYTVRDETDGQ